MKLSTSNLVHKLDLALAYQKTTFMTKIGGGLGQGSIQKIWDPLLISATVDSNLVHKFGLGLAYQKRRWGPKLAGIWARGASKKLGPTKLGLGLAYPYLFLQPLKLATSNFVYNLGLGLSYQKTTFRPKLAEAWARGASEKNWDPLFISETVEARDWKLVHNMSSGLPCQTQVLGPNYG